MAGGTHHAHFSYGSGYCIFNDLAICAIKAINNFQGIKTVLIIDLDVHQGDGTASILENYQNIFTFSMHCSIEGAVISGIKVIDELKKELK